jgi:hypothetical protein
MNAWEEFGRWCLTELRGNIGADLDGGDAQDKAIALGILGYVTVTEPCSEEYCHCAEYYDEFPVQCLRTVLP